MRKKINYQRTEYSENGELICFGLSEHIMEEKLPSLSEKAEKELNNLFSIFDKNNVEGVLPRPGFSSTKYSLSYDNRAHIRFLLSYLAIRELPIKNFYTRSFIMYFYVTWFMFRLHGKGISAGDPIVM